MPFVVDLIPSSPEIEAASALGLAVSQRKSKGLFGKKQYEPIEVLARFGLPLRTVTWTPGETSGRCLAFDLQGLVSGAIRFDLDTKLPDPELDPETGEEAFLNLCQQWTKSATDLSPSVLEFAGLITQPDQVAPLLDGEDETLLVNFEQKADPDNALSQLTEQLEGYKQAAKAWAELKQKAYTHRDILADRIQNFAQEEREAGNKSLEDLTSQVETAIAAKRGETDADLAKAQEESEKRNGMLKEELDRAQERFKENGDNYWRDQIKTVEKNIADNDKALAKQQYDLEAAFKAFEGQQKSKISQFKAELEKRLATFETRLKRLDAVLEGFSKGLDTRMNAYEQQPNRVAAATVEISNERCAKEHNAVFHAVRYPGNRWVVLPPQVIGSRGILGAVGGLFGGLNLPFKPASKLAETLAGKLQTMLPGSELEGKLAEANLLEDENFLPRAKTGLGDLVDQGKLDKKYANLFNDIQFGSGTVQEAGSDEGAEPAPPGEEPENPQT